MARQLQRPTREQGGVHDDYVEKHPAFGMIGVNRVTSGPPGKSLFASDFRHQHYMTISIRKAEVARSLSNDWYHGRGEIVEVALSEAQWATFVSSQNHGFGVPCTIEAIDGQYVPGIANIADRTAQFRGEAEKAMKDAVESIDSIINSGKLSKAAVTELEVVKSRITGSQDFILRQFDEHMEKTVEKAKSEIHGWVTSHIQRAGLEALAANGPILELETGEESE